MANDKRTIPGFFLAVTIIVSPIVAPLASPKLSEGGQPGVDEHVAAARAAARDDYKGLFDRLCTPEARPPQARGGATAPATPRPAVPDRSSWHAEPVKVFDNLYFVGTREHSAWAIVTSAGIIVTDPLYAYAVEDEVAAGLKKVGLNPADIKYVLVSHGHGDHSGGAGYLQDTFNARVILSAADWDLLARNTRDTAKPKRDMVAADGQQLTLGDTTLTLYLTPGHTPGTISTLIPVRDGSTRHVVALWGGTAFNFQQTPQNYENYIASAEKFAAITAKAGVDVIISNHTAFDGSTAKLRALASRKPGAPHPYVVGAEGIKRYLTVASECAKAGLARLPSP
jgi:metallo-beta-lactamase class B